MKIAKILLSVPIVLVFFFACNKKETPVDVAVLDENILVEGMYADMSEMTEICMYKAEDMIFDTAKTSEKDLISDCAILNVSPSDTFTWPKNYTIDFGSNNCLCDDGRYRRGKVNVNTTGMYSDLATELTLSYDNYFLNDNKLSATVTIINMGLNTASYPNYTVSIQNATLVTSKGTISWQTERVKTWVNGNNTPWPLNNDDVFIHTGNSSGTYTDGTAFDVQIISPLLTNTYCPWIRSGVMEVTRQDNTVYTLDFGAGECDSLANIIVDGNEFGVGLR